MEINIREIELLHKTNKDLGELLNNLNILVADISALTEVVYDREIQRCDGEIDIKLHSHM